MIKVGDRVKRIKQGTVTPYKGMRIGDEDVVVEVHERAITLERFGDGHSPTAFKVIPTNMENI